MRKTIFNFKGKNNAAAHMWVSSFVSTNVVMFRAMAAFTSNAADVSPSSHLNESTIKPDEAATASIA